MPGNASRNSARRSRIRCTDLFDIVAPFFKNRQDSLKRELFWVCQPLIFAVVADV